MVSLMMITNNCQFQALIPASNDPVFDEAEVEAAFAKLLCQSGVEPDWT